VSEPEPRAHSESARVELEGPRAFHRRPLDSYPVIRTENADELCAAVGNVYGPHSFELSPDAGRLHAKANHCSLGKVGFSYAGYGVRARAEFPELDAFAQQFCISGAEEVTIDGSEVQVTPERSCIASPGSGLTLEYTREFEQLVLRIDRAALMQKLTAITGEAPPAALKFDPAQDFKSEAAASLRRIFLFFVSELDRAKSPLPRLLRAEIEQMLMVSFLCGNRHNHSHLLEGRPRGAAPWQVRRAEAYIEAHWDQPITVEALAVATGASVRSLFHSFRHSRGCSPMAMVKQLRLRHAREMLVIPSTNASVTDVAFACGFSNLGHFAKDYCKTFGELPSRTLNRTKGGMTRV
jgi:AraC-like DNA-binding protein